ncbi:MAG: UvrD/REP helicase [Labilithrix sp.]|nr:UvrD/REP helicase [Labilithrix sp.]
MSHSNTPAGRGITIVSASAGSGKTYRLTTDVSDAVAPGGADPLPLESLVAVTYTKKAHAELTARIRQRLVKEGAFDAALELPLAYLGTVHAMCLRLLQEFAIDAGLSPNVDVVTGDAGKLLRASLEAALPEQLSVTLERLAASFQLHFDNVTKRTDWVRPVSDIMDLARSNRIAADRLPAMAERSLAGMFRMLPPAEASGDALEDALAGSLARAIKALRENPDGTKTTAERLEDLEKKAEKLRDRELLWSDWSSLSSASAAKKSEHLLDDLRLTASRWEGHPRLHAEMRELTTSIYEAARIGLSAYQEWKTRRRVVDYVDMLDRALDLASHPRVAAELAARLRLVVVDEFQDTSPIQLALFVKLHAMSDRSIWVGDRKQCIFEYAGADPQLMDAVAAWVEASGGTRDVLGKNYRSRPELVAACSELFAAALGRHGFTRGEVVVAPARVAPPELAALPPLGFWALESKKKDEHAIALAEGVARLLASPEQTPVIDRTTDAARPVRPGDVAVLVATNDEAALLAGALHARGLRVAIARAGLLETPEGTLVDAALRWLLDAGDTLAAAKIDVLLGAGERDSDAWLASLLPLSPTALRESGEQVSPGAGWRDALSPLRALLSLASPAEAVDRVLASLDLVQVCARWPDPTQRVANLDALRGLAADYEERCAQEREAATVAGLLRYFDDVSEKRLRKGEMIGSDDQHVPTDDGAVIVATYHKSKGLEWPVVVLSSLDRTERRRAFNDVSPESESEDGTSMFDAREPLKGRWIRYWPWPLGGTRTGSLADRAAETPEGQRVQQREEKERARLLYVGFTRARDHLVLAAQVKTNKATKKEPAVSTACAQWLDGLCNAAGEPLLVLPAGAADGERASTQLGPSSLATRVWRLGASPAEATSAAEEPRRWFVRGPAPAAAPAAHRILPSSAAEQWPELMLGAVGAIEALPGALAITGKVEAFDVLGDAVHAFLASDVPGLSPGERLTRATRILAGAAMSAHVQPAELLAASDRLVAFVAARWPSAVWHREVSIDARVVTAAGPRQVGGIIDLLLETPDGFVIVDHKTFPGTGAAALRAKVTSFLPQLAAYREAVAWGGARKVTSSWVHLPAAGAMVEVR